jgi:hypothetical protein
MSAKYDISGCLDGLELDVLLAGSDELELKRRLAACVHCQRRLADLEANRAATMTPAHVAAQAAAILARLRPARSRWRLAVRFSAPVLALAAVVVMVVMWPQRHPGAAGPARVAEAIRWKGADRFEVLQVRPGPSRVVVDGEQVAAGATLSFRAACARGCSVTMFAVGDDGASVLDDQVAPPWAVAPGELTQLPVSVEIDDSAGGDRVVAFLCSRVVATAALRAALARPAPAEVDGCEVHQHRVARGPGR